MLVCNCVIFSELLFLPGLLGSHGYREIELHSSLDGICFLFIKNNRGSIVTQQNSKHPCRINPCVSECQKQGAGFGKQRGFGTHGNRQLAHVS